MGFVDSIRKHASTSMDSTQRSQRRRLILQDTVALLSLFGITIVIAVITYFFFSSFRTHRQVLEQRWFQRGQQAMANGNATDAVEAFRSALTLSSGNRSYEMALANALVAAGRIDEAYAYYSTLRDEEPGDGLLNLQLARLSVKKKDATRAIAYYQAALDGDWRAEGVSHRREARLELAQYQLVLHKPVLAQGELLTAEGNALEDPVAMNRIAALLEQASDSSDALTAYQRASLHAKPNTPARLQALLGESHAAESLGQYRLAAVALEHYLANLHQVLHPPVAPAVVEQSLDRLQRLLALNPLPSLPPRERAQRLLTDGSLAHKRYADCLASLQNMPTLDTGATPLATDAASLRALAPLWLPFTKLRRNPLADDLQAQDSLATLINQTELLTNRLCGPPTGDNALLLQLATVPNKSD